MSNHNPKISNAAASAAANAVCALANGAKLRLYDGTQPATADTAIVAQNILSEHALGNPDEPGAVNGVATFSAIGDDTDANNTGNATWFSVWNAADNARLFDGSVGVTGSGSDIEMPTVAIQQHATVSVTSFSYTASKG